MSQTLFWPPFLNRIIFFKFYFKNVNVFMFFNFEPNFIEKFLWKSGFSNFGHMTFFAKRKFVFVFVFVFVFFFDAILNFDFETVQSFEFFFAGVWL